MQIQDCFMQNNLIRKISSSKFLGFRCFLVKKELNTKFSQRSRHWFESMLFETEVMASNLLFTLFLTFEKKALIPDSFGLFTYTART